MEVITVLLQMAAEAIQIAIRVMEEGGDSKND